MDLQVISQRHRLYPYIQPGDIVVFSKILYVCYNVHMYMVKLISYSCHIHTIHLHTIHMYIFVHFTVCRSDYSDVRDVDPGSCARNSSVFKMRAEDNLKHHFVTARSINVYLLPNRFSLQIVLASRR